MQKLHDQLPFINYLNSMEINIKCWLFGFAVVCSVRDESKVKKRTAATDVHSSFVQSMNHAISRWRQHNFYALYESIDEKKIYNSAISRLQSQRDFHTILLFYSGIFTPLVCNCRHKRRANPLMCGNEKF